MKGPRVNGVTLRTILTSQGEPTVEAQVTLAGGATGVASSPVAIAPGRRERARGTTALSLGPLSGAYDTLARRLRGLRTEGQRTWDDTVCEAAGGLALGTVATLPLSLAYAKATAADERRPLHVHLARFAGTRPAMPALLMNVFSGGIHRPGPARDFQQIMVVVDRTPTTDAVAAALHVFRRVEARRTAAAGFRGYSASSGLLVEGADTTTLLGELRRELDAAGADFGLGFDVAAEHLRLPDGRYGFEGGAYEGAELAERITDFVSGFGVRFVEDPFDPDDEPLWRKLTDDLHGRAAVVGDDLFATDPDRMTAGLAGGVVLKMNQIGTVSGTVDAAARARELGMDCCVSHRSGETEDTSMCDLAVALAARFIKVGGPRRGDRTARYNQLLRLAEELTPAPAP